MTRDPAYRIAAALILLGVALMCQPFSVTLYTLGFPVVIAGVLAFVVLDHLPAPAEVPEDVDARGQREQD
jgi:hypothetical protein